MLRLVFGVSTAASAAVLAIFLGGLGLGGLLLGRRADRTRSPLRLYADRLALAVVVLGLPAVLMGGTLPAAVRAVERGADAGRRRTGLLYGANTLGAVGGSLYATFLA